MHLSSMHACNRIGANVLTQLNGVMRSGGKAPLRLDEQGTKDEGQPLSRRTSKSQEVSSQQVEALSHGSVQEQHSPSIQLQQQVTHCAPC